VCSHKFVEEGSHGLGECEGDLADEYDVSFVDESSEDELKGTKVAEVDDLFESR
jgi:hypothetical protein